MKNLKKTIVLTLIPVLFATILYTGTDSSSLNKVWAKMVTTLTTLTTYTTYVSESTPQVGTSIDEISYRTLFNSADLASFTATCGLYTGDGPAPSIATEIEGQRYRIVYSADHNYYAYEGAPCLGTTAYVTYTLVDDGLPEDISSVPTANPYAAAEKALTSEISAAAKDKAKEATIEVKNDTLPASIINLLKANADVPVKATLTKGNLTYHMNLSGDAFKNADEKWYGPLYLLPRAENKYAVESGSFKKVLPGSDAFFTIKAGKDKLTGISVNAKEVPEKYYTAVTDKKGNVKVTVSSDYLKTLSSKTYGIAFLFEENVAYTGMVIG